MKALVRTALLASAVVLCVGAAPNWNATVVKTDGGYRVGNPDAAVKLVAFESYTCPHCAHFQKEAGGPLEIAYVRSGKVSLEIRHFVRDPVDLTAAMLADCGPPSKFFQNHAAFLLSQDDWMKTLVNATKAQQNRWYSGDKAARRRAIAGDLGFYTLMQNRGYGRVQLDQCLNDEAKAKQLAQTTADDEKKFKVEGTPSFLLNGVLLFATHEWSLLRPQIDARL